MCNLLVASEDRVGQLLLNQPHLEVGNHIGLFLQLLFEESLLEVVLLLGDALRRHHQRALVAGLHLHKSIVFFLLHSIWVGILELTRVERN